MKVRKRIIEIYNDDYQSLIKDLKSMSKSERYELYGFHIRMLFPKSKDKIIS